MCVCVLKKKVKEQLSMCASWNKSQILGKGEVCAAMKRKNAKKKRVSHALNISFTLAVCKRKKLCQLQLNHPRGSEWTIMGAY